MKYKVSLINLDAAEFYHSLILCKDGAPVATGTINITHLPIGGKGELEDDQQWTTNITDPNQPFELMRSVIQYIMIDKDLVKSNELDVTITKILEALEVISYLYNCNKIQLDNNCCCYCNWSFDKTFF